MRSNLLRVAAVLLLLSLAAVAFVLWQRSQPLTNIADQPFLFEQRARELNIPSQRPAVAATVAGGLYLLSANTTEQTSTLTLRMSHDGGEHWMQPTTLNSPGSSVTTSAENAPQLAARGMYAFALWQEKNETGGPQLRVARSSGMNAKPPSSTQVIDKSSADTSYSGFASLSLAPNGDIYVAWLDGRDQTSAATGTFNVYIARSTDGGLSFHHNVRVATLACPCCRPSVAIGSDGKVYVAYRHVFRDNERDIAVAVSTDSAEHFSAPVRVSSDRWKLYGCPESGPVIALQGDSLVVAWYTAASDRPGIRAAVSTDNGSTFSHPVIISREIQSANHPYLAESNDGKLAIAFSGRTIASSGDWGDIRPFVVRIDSRGRVSAPVGVPSNTPGARYPVLSLAPDGDTYVTWSSPDAPKVYLARAVSR